MRTLIMKGHLTRILRLFMVLLLCGLCLGQASRSDPVKITFCLDEGYDVSRLDLALRNETDGRVTAVGTLTAAKSAHVSIVPGRYGIAGYANSTVVLQATAYSFVKDDEFGVSAIVFGDPSVKAPLEIRRHFALSRTVRPYLLPSRW
jgi:hypothetical protein